MSAYLQSKTLWIAVLATLLAVALAVQSYLTDHPGQWTATEWLGALVVVLGVVLAQLRLSGAPPIPGTPADRKQTAVVEAVRTETVQQLTKQFETVQRVRDGVQINGPTVARNIAGHTISYQERAGTSDTSP